MIRTWFTLFRQLHTRLHNNGCYWAHLNREGCIGCAVSGITRELDGKHVPLCIHRSHLSKYTLFSTNPCICISQHLPGFQSDRNGSLIACLHTMDYKDGRFASNVTIANLLVTSMAAKPFDPHTCTSVGIGGTRTQDHVWCWVHNALTVWAIPGSTLHIYAHIYIL